MTIAEIEAGVESIKAIARNDEAAHSMEDELRQLVLESIADGASDAADMARAVLKTSDIEFSRWCA